MRPAALGLLLVVLAAPGCARQRTHLRTYAPLPAERSLELLAQRSELVANVTAEALVTLRRADGRSIRLDSAVVMEPPHHARVRAWKFGRAVFDLTITPQGAWLTAPQPFQESTQIRSAAQSTAHFARQWSLLSGTFFREPGLEIVQQTQDVLRVRRPSGDGEPEIVCEVDRATLTPRRYTIHDKHRRPRFQMRLDRYEQFGDLAWPRRIRADSEEGRVTIDMRSVELNGDLPAEAFRPPRRAEKLP